MTTFKVTGFCVVDFDHHVRPHTVDSVAGSGLDQPVGTETPGRLAGLLYLNRQEEWLDVRSTY
jgi:hypothetical protein